MEQLLDPKIITFVWGNDLPDTTQTVYRSQKITRPTDPAGLTVEGWYMEKGVDDDGGQIFDDNKIWDFDTVPDSDMTLYANCVKSSTDPTAPFGNVVDLIQWLDSAEVNQPGNAYPLVLENINAEDFAILNSALFSKPNIFVSLDLSSTDVSKIDSNAFKDCTGLTNIILPDTVTSIEENAFSGCSNLTSLTIPNSVTSIGKSAFYNCGFTNITIPDSVKTIGDNAFHYCRSLISVTIGQSIISIGDSAFFDCTNLASVTFVEGITLTCGSSATGGGLSSNFISQGDPSLYNAIFANSQINGINPPYPVKAGTYTKSSTGGWGYNS
jgi:hypothetical protein